MDDLNRKTVRSERSWYDPYLQAACWERTREQQRSQRIWPDEASWARLERRPLDGMLYRWCSSILLNLVRWLLYLPNRTRAAVASPGAEAAWRPATPPRVARYR